MRSWLPWAAILGAAIVARAMDPVWEPLERIGYDARLSLRPDAGWPDDLVLVPIDERAMLLKGNWPWARDAQADFLTRLRRYGAKTIAMDALALTHGDAASDAALAGALDHVVIGVGTTHEKSGVGSLDALRHIAFPGLSAAEGATLAPEDFLVPVEPFRSHALGLGHVAFFPKAPDSVVRSHAPFLGMEGLAGAIPSLSLRAFLLQRGIPTGATHLTANELRIGDRSIALHGGEFALDFVPGGRPPRTVRASDLLEGKDPAALRGALNGALALVYVDSVFAPDRFQTPLSPQTPGGVLHASAIRTYASGRTPRAIPGSLPFGVTVATGLLWAGAISRRPASQILTALLVATGGVAALTIGLTHFADAFLPVIRTESFLMLAGGALVAITSTRQGEERTRLLALLHPRGEPATLIRPASDLSTISRGEARTMAPASRRNDAPPEETLLLGRYIVQREIGRGGMGAVYLAQDQDLDRYVAIKVLSSSAPGPFARFRREALAVGGIAHSNVVTVFEVGLDAKVPFLVLEFVPGGSIADLLDDPDFEVPMPWIRATRLIASIAHGLGAAHARGIVHRDVKLANMLLLERRGDVAKIADFGIAKLSGAETLTKEGSFVGTIGYLAPEQATTGDVDARSDVFSLGIAWYRLVTGQSPYQGTSAEILRAAVTATIPDPRKRVPAFPAELAAILLRMTALERSGRPSDGREVAREIEAVLETVVTAANS